MQMQSSLERPAINSKQSERMLEKGVGQSPVESEFSRLERDPT